VVYLGENIELRARLATSEEHNRRIGHEMNEKQRRVSVLEESLNKLRRSQSCESLNSEGRIKNLEDERDCLIEENSKKHEMNRALQVKADKPPKVLSRALASMYKDRIHKLETLLQQQNEFIEQHEAEMEKVSASEAKIGQLSLKIEQMKDGHRKDIEARDVDYEDICKQLQFKKSALKEARELNVELKEIVEENAESTHEFTSIISSQREEIENLRKIIADNNFEDPMKIPVIEISPDKADRQRISSADSSTPTVVEGQIDNGDAAKDLDSSHLLKPIHADVLLRIESTNSESSRGDQPEQPKARSGENRKKSWLDWKNLRRRTHQGRRAAEFNPQGSNRLEHLRRMIPSAISSGADISADGEGYDRDDCDVTENKRRKSKIELDRIRQLGEKQKIKEKSREREPVHLEPDASGKDQTRKSGPTKAGQEHRSNSGRPTQRNSKPTKNGRSKPDSKPSKKNSKQTNNKPPRSKRKWRDRKQFSRIARAAWLQCN